MALILPVDGVMPQIAENCFLAPNATITGQVTLGTDCSVWFNAVIRGDVNTITIGNQVNIQDNVVIHATYRQSATQIANRVNIGHSAIVHGCTLEERVLIGMGAIVMDNAVVESDVLIAAGSVVLENSRCQSGWLYAGTPAKAIKPLTPAQLQLLQQLPDRYIMYAGWYDL